jgi:hypothetical protein
MRVLNFTLSLQRRAAPDPNAKNAPCILFQAGSFQYKIRDAAGTWDFICRTNFLAIKFFSLSLERCNIKAAPFHGPGRKGIFGSGAIKLFIYWVEKGCCAAQHNFLLLFITPTNGHVPGKNPLQGTHNASITCLPGIDLGISHVSCTGC